MALSVRQLIAKLKKMNQDALVVTQSHDQDEEEFDAYVGSVREIEGRLVEGQKHVLEKYQATGLVALR